MYLFREVLIYRQVTEWLWNVVSHALNQHALSAAPVNIMLVQMLSFLYASPSRYAAAVSCPSRGMVAQDSGQHFFRGRFTARASLCRFGWYQSVRPPSGGSSSHLRCWAHRSHHVVSCQRGRG